MVQLQIAFFIKVQQLFLKWLGKFLNFTKNYKNYKNYKINDKLTTDRHTTGTFPRTREAVWGAGWHEATGTTVELNK